MRERYDAAEKKYRPLFDKAVRARDTAETQAEKDEKQREVTKYYDLMHADGYFRDSYNSSSVLWQYDLSWWNDIVPLCKDGKLNAEGIKKFLALLDTHEKNFEHNMVEGRRRENLSGEEVQEPVPTQEEEKYFRDAAEELRAFLNEALREGIEIDASL